MPPSQLKQLKASLRDHGLVGPQKSRKQKKAASKDGGKRLARNAALEGIRERFNPFEVKAPARPVKFEVTSNKPKKSGPGRPGITKGLGEERRRGTLLKEIQSRNKVGGILDRRFGENDPTMTPEQRAAERFAKQNERKAKKNSMFNLEDGEAEEMALTHGGEVLGLGDFNMNKRDDFDENDLESSEESIDYNADDIDNRPRKRARLDEDAMDGPADSADQLPERKKSKAEVMKEVMAKSKLYKYERQQAKQDDDDLRAELDKDMSGIYEAMREFKERPKTLPTPPSTDSEPTMNPDRAAMLAGKDPEAIEKEYNERMRQMALDARSKPSTRTKTDEEKATEEATRLQDLEKKRLKRMQGEEESSESEIEEASAADDEEEQDDAELFGISQPAAAPARKNLDVEDEDEFVLDDNLIASDSEADMASRSNSDSSEEDESEAEDDGDDEFINGLVLPPTNGTVKPASTTTSLNLAYMYPCPQTHKELLATLKGTKSTDLPTIVQRIRALYHSRLAEGNIEKLGKFAIALIKHVSYMADQAKVPDFGVIESLLRHLHSMAKTHPDAVAFGYRSRLRKIAEERPLALSNGDLILLTGISTTFPTSDQFHSVVTPAMLTIARYLGQGPVQGYRDLTVGAYCCTLALKYQNLSKRYVPEVVTYITNALAVLAPTPLPESVVDLPNWLVHLRTTSNSLRVSHHGGKSSESVSFASLYGEEDEKSSPAVNLLLTFVNVLDEASQSWQAKSAFTEIFAAPMSALKHILSKSCKKLIPSNDYETILTIHASISTLQEKCTTSRKPLLLHNHRPLAIKLSIPKFEEGYNPDRHYDPDRERNDLNKLKAEHKRERKGAMRELRKDSNFIARESLREKKDKDEAHAKREKRLIAEIQGEEGHERKEYEREKMKRKGTW